MAETDVVLTVGVEPEVDLSKLESSIERAFSGLNIKTQKIKVDFDIDSSSLKKLQDQINKSSPNINIKSSGAGTVAGEYKEIEASAKKAAGAVENLGASIKQAGSAGLWNDDAANSMKTLIVNTTAYENALKRISKDLQTVHTNTEKWTAAQNGSSSQAYKEYTEQAAALKTLTDDIGTGQMKLGEFNERISVIESSMASASEEIAHAGENARATTESLASATKTLLTADTKAYTDDLAKIDQQLIKIQSNSSKWAAAQNGSASSAYNTYVEQANALKELRAELESGSLSVDEFNKKFSSIKAVMTEASLSIRTAAEEIARAEQQMKSLNTLNTSIDKSLTGLTKISGTEEEKNNVKELTSLYDEWAVKVRELNNEKSTDTAAISSLQSQGQYIQSLITEYENLSAATSQYNQILNAMSSDTALNSSAADIEILIGKYEELTAAIEQYKSSGTYNEEEVSRIHELEAEIQNLIGSINERVSAEEKAAQAAQKDADSTKKAAQATKEEARVNKQFASAQKTRESAINSGANALNRYTAAQKSSNEESRNAYGSIGSAVSKLKELNAEEAKTTEQKLQFINATNRENAVIKESTNVIKANGDSHRSLASSLNNLTVRFTSWFGVSQTVMAMVRAVREMVSASMEIESSMAQIQIVTGATGSELEEFFSTASEMAQELGQSITDVASSIETFSRLGYDLPDASTLAEYATILSNVASVTTEEATTGLTSVIKGFGLEVEDAEHVSDVLVEVGQNYAVSAEEILEAMERSSAAMAATNTTFEQSAAIVAAGNAAVQDASTVGTALKTVSARIRGSTTELEELGEETEGLADGLSKYRDELQALTGFDIMVDDNTYKNIYEIFDGISQIWDDLSDTAQSRVSEILGGTRQLQVISSIMNNWDDAAEAYADAMDSAGVATEANEIVMETTEKHVEQLKASFQELAVDIFDSDMMKGFVDAAKAALDVVDSLVDRIGVLGTVITTVLAGSTLRNLIKLRGTDDWGYFNGFEKTTSVLNQTFTNSSGAISKFAASFESARAAGNSLFTSLGAGAVQFIKSLNPATVAIAGVTAALGIGITAYKNYREAAKEARETEMEEGAAAREEADNIQSLYSTYKDAQEAYESNTGSKEELESATDSLLEALGVEQYQIETLIAEYGDLDSVIQNVTTKVLGQELNEATEAYNAAREQLLDTANHVSLSDNVSRTVFFGEDSARMIEYLETMVDLAKTENSLGGGNFALAGDTSTVEGVLEMYEDILSYEDMLNQGVNVYYSEDELVSSSLYQSLENTKGLLEGDYENLLTATKNRNELAAMLEYNEVVADSGLPETQEEFNQFRDVMIEAAASNENFVGSEEEVQSAIDNVLSSIPELSDFIDSYTESIENMDKRVHEALTDIYTSVIDENELTGQARTIAMQSATQAASIVGDIYDSLPDDEKEYAFSFIIDDSGIKDASTDSIEKYVRQAESAYDDYIDVVNEAAERGIDTTQTVFGNIDTDNRQILTWTEETLEQNKEALLSWENISENTEEAIAEAWEECKESYIGYYSTVLGHDVHQTVGDVDYTVAVSTVLNTDEGPLLLNKNNLYEYVDKIFDEAIDRYGDEWTAEDIFRLDTRGLEIDGQYIQGIIADIGETAEYTAGAMHYTGETGAIAAEYNRIAEAAEKAGIPVDAFMESMEEYGEISDEAVQAIANYQASMQAAHDAAAIAFNIDLDAETESMSAFTAALSEATDASGLTAESLATLKDRYKDLDGYDADRLFEDTAHGIRLNADEVNKLESEYEQLNIDGLQDKLDALIREYNTAKDSLSDYTYDIDIYKDKLSDLDAIQANIEATQEQISQYGALTSAYSAWQDALSSSNNRDSYEAIGKNYESMKQMMDLGWYNTDDINAYLDLMLSADQRTGDNIEDFEKLTKTIEGTNHSITDYWKYDSDGNLVSDGLFDLLDDLNKYDSDLVQIGDDGSYTFNLLGDNFDKAADYLGISGELLDLMILAFKDVGAVSMGDLIDDLDLVSNAAQEANDSLIQMGETDTVFNFEASDEDLLAEIKEAQELYDQLAYDENGELNINAEGAQDALTILLTLLTRKQELSEPEILSIDTSQLDAADSDIGNAIDLFQQLTNDREKIELEVAAGLDTSDTEEDIQKIVGEISTLDPEIFAKLGLDEESLASLNGAIESIKADIEAGVDLKQEDIDTIQEVVNSIEVDEIELSDNSKDILDDMKAVQEFTIDDKPFQVTITNYSETYSRLITIRDELNGLEDQEVNVTINRTTVNKTTDEASGAAGTAHAGGTAQAQGNWGAKRTETALVGELGTEIVVSPKDGTWHTVGDNGAEMAEIHAGDIVFNAEQTEQILKYGKIKYGSRRGTALAQGTAYAGKGTDLQKRKSTTTVTTLTEQTTTTTTNNASSTTKSKSSTSKNSSKSSSGSGSTDDKTDTVLQDFQDWLSKLFDWIEVKLERQTDKISQYIAKAETALDAGNYRASSRNYRNAIGYTARQAGTESQGAARYERQANKVMSQAVSEGLIGSDEEAAKIKKRVQNGTIDISKYSDRVQEVISAYKDWYDKSVECSDAIESLHQDIRTYIQDLKDLRDAQRDTTIESLNTFTEIGTSTNAYTARAQNQQLNYTNSQLQAQNTAYRTETKRVNTDTNKLAKKATSATSSALKDAKGKTYRNALKDAQKSINAGEKVSSSTLKTIKAKDRTVYERLYAYNLSLDNLETARLEEITNYAATSAQTYSNTLETYSNTQAEYSNKASIYEQQSSNATSAASKNSYLDQAATEYTKISSSANDAVKDITKDANHKAKKIGEWSGTTSAYNSASAKTQKAVQKCINKAKSAAASGKAIDSSVISELAEYESEGYVTRRFMNECIDYNNAIEAKQQAEDAAAIAKEEEKAYLASLGTERVQNVQQEYQNKETTNQNRTSLLEAQQNTRNTRGLSTTKEQYQELIDQSKGLQEIYQAERDAIAQTIQENLNSGYWTEDSQEYLDAAASLDELDVAIQNCTTDQEEYNNAVAQLPYDALEAELELLDAIAALNKSQASLISARGEDLSEQDYLQQIEDNNKIIDKTNEELQQAYQDMLQAEADPEGVYGGKTLAEWQAYCAELKTTINDTEADNEALKDSLRDDVYWRDFERAHDACQRFENVLSGVMDLISSDMLYDSEGKLTEFGVAQVANLVSEYENAQEEVQNYTNDLENLYKLYDEGWYTLDEFEEKQNELQTSLLDSASSMKSAMDEIVNMYKDMAQSELDALFDLIDARNKALSAKKSYYDYDKSISSKTGDIASLQAQIAALEGVETAEARAKKATLEAQLAEAEEDLNDTVNDHIIEISQNALDDLQETLQDTFDEYWDNISSDLEELANLMSLANDLTETSAETINGTLNKLLEFYGIDTEETRIGENFATGTKKVSRDMMATVNEKGGEAIVTKNGVLMPLEYGDGVLPADLTKLLFDVAKNGGLQQQPPVNIQMPTVSVPNVDLTGIGETNIEQYYDSLINIEGSADAATVEDLKNMKSSLLEDSYTYTKKKMYRGYQDVGGKRHV